MLPPWRIASARRDLPIGVIGVLPPFGVSFIRPLPGEWVSALSADMHDRVIGALGPAGLPRWRYCQLFHRPWDDEMAKSAATTVLRRPDQACGLGADKKERNRDGGI